MANSSILWTLAIVCFVCVSANDSDFFGDTDTEREKPSSHVPTIETKPRSIYVDKGDKVELECRVHRLEGYNVLWLKGAQMLTLGSIRSTADDRIQLKNTTLVISNFMDKDVGEYTCKIGVQNPVISITHKVFLKAPPKIEKTEPQETDLEVNEGEKVVLACRASGRPPPKIMWKNEDFDLRPTVTGVVSKDGETLIFDSIQQTDAGQYECLAKNGIGGGDRKVFRLKVLYPPKITIEKLLIPSGDGTTMELLCKVKAEPQAKVSWKHAGEIVNPGSRNYERYQIKTSHSQHLLTLCIPNIEETDFGDYTCLASNSKGTAKEVVRVEGSPTRVKFRSSPDGTIDTSYILQFETQSAKPLIEFKLLLRKVTPNGDQTDPKWVEVIIPANQQSSPRYMQSFNITGLESASVYGVVMQARNDHNWNEQSQQFLFTTLGASLGDDGSKIASTTESEKKEIKSGLTNESNGNEGNGSGEPHLDQRAKMVAIMTVVILIAFF